MFMRLHINIMRVASVAMRVSKQQTMLKRCGKSEHNQNMGERVLTRVQHGRTRFNPSSTWAFSIGGQVLNGRKRVVLLVDACWCFHNACCSVLRQLKETVKRVLPRLLMIQRVASDEHG